jgi:hypothetical protein
MRTIAAGAVTVLNGRVCPLIVLVEMMLSTPVRLASSACHVEYGGDVYLAAGSLGTIDEIDDSPGDYKSMRFTISGLPSDAIALARSEDIRNKAVTVHLAILDPETHVILDAPQVWAGTLDRMPIEEGNGTATISVVAEHRGATFSRPKPLRYTDADQQRLYPGDTSLRFVVSQASHQDVWPAASWFRQ